MLITSAESFYDFRIGITCQNLTAIWNVASKFPNFALECGLQNFRILLWIWWHFALLFLCIWWHGLSKFCCLILIGFCSNYPFIDYFRKGNSGQFPDDVIQAIGMTYNRFAIIYTALRLYDEDEARSRGMSQKSNRENYYALYKCHPVWDSAIVGFQSMRNPGRNISIDESMCKFKVGWLTLALSPGTRKLYFRRAPTRGEW